jgi:hypothetical protein
MGDLSLESYNEETATTVLSARSQEDGSFSGGVVLHIEADTLSGKAINGVQGYGQGAGSVGVVGLSHTGVLGEGQVIGVIGRLSKPASALPPTFDNAGVLGTSFGDRQAGGVIGESDVGYGVYATTGTGIAVRGDSEAGPGVFGESVRADGVFGYGAIAGVKGIGNDIGVHGESLNGVGVFGRTGDPANQIPGKLAGFFVGRVFVVGPFTVFGGPKSAAVPHPDGSHRLLYAMESPESWFEDFGEAKLSNGRAEVKLDPDFAAVVKTATYHVFVTPYSDSNGLYVSHRSDNGFEVREQQGGKSNAPFSYRVIAKRKDVAEERLAKVILPTLPRSEKKEPAPRPKRSTSPPHGVRPKPQSNTKEGR